MCGIAGIFDTRERRPIEPALIQRMNARQFHRGPDEGGVHCEPGVGLGHRRLSIIDLSSGQQPLFNEDGSVVVSFNGEIYNYQALVKELTALGHKFRTHSDTEAIVHAWEEWGEDCVLRFRGMFAFAIYDRNRETLFLARDRVGKKPLYYTLRPDGILLFASEIKAILAVSETLPDLDAQSVEDYFAFGYVPDPKTIFKGFYKLAPGHVLAMRRGVSLATPRQYWDLCFKEAVAVSEDNIRDELVERLREAVRVRLVSEVPLGAFLSGGVDSSSIVALMAGLARDRVKTCSIAFRDPRFDESAWAEKHARRYATEHFFDRVESEDFTLVDTLAGCYDEPFADSSALPTYRVCELARRHVTVAISGDGGDETFAGYRRYRWHMNEERIRRRIPLGVRRPFFGILGAVYPKADWAPRIVRAKTTLQALSRDRDAAYFHTVTVIPDHERLRLFSPAFLRRLQGYRAIEVFRTHARNAPDDALARAQYLDFKTYLPGDILTKVDRASMAHALEVRVPMLDHEFLEWTATIASSQKLHGQNGKYILKKAMEPFVEKDILYREKMGFSVPLAAWFRGALRERLHSAVMGSVLADTGIFDRVWLNRMITSHQSGRRDFSAALWAVLMFDAFLRNNAGAVARSRAP
jgi:asparagine synthase (glutamine-hydrolysing)